MYLHVVFTGMYIDTRLLKTFFHSEIYSKGRGEGGRGGRGRGGRCTEQEIISILNVSNISVLSKGRYEKRGESGAGGRGLGMRLGQERWRRNVDKFNLGRCRVSKGHRRPNLTTLALILIPSVPFWEQHSLAP